MQSRILVISPNSEKYPCPVIPTGALQLHAELKAIYEDTYFIDLCFKEDKYKSLINKLFNVKPNIIIISIRNIDNETFLKPKFYLEDVKEVVTVCRKNSQAKIIIGGIGFRINPKEIFNYLNVDYGIIESRFQAIKSLIKHINQFNEKEVKHIEGILYWNEGFININETVNNNTRDVKYNWNHIIQNCDLQYYPSKNGTPQPPSFGLRTKIGCACNCIHCSIPKLEGRILRCTPVEELINTIKLMQTKFGIKRIYFTDNVFNIPYNHAYELCSEICRNNIKINWTCYVHPKNLDRDLVRMMIKAGCDSVQFGIDTACEELIEKWGKGFTTKDLINASKICREENLRSFYSLLFGCWEETPKTLKESLQVLKEAKAGFIWGAYGVRIYPNTKLAELLYKNHMLDKNDKLLYPKFYLSPQIEEKGLEIIEEFKKNNPKIIIKVNTGDT